MKIGGDVMRKGWERGKYGYNFFGQLVYLFKIINMKLIKVFLIFFSIFLMFYQIPIFIFISKFLFFLLNRSKIMQLKSLLKAV